MEYIKKLNVIQNQLSEAMIELKDVNLVENELVYDYVFEAHRLCNELKVQLN